MGRMRLALIMTVCMIWTCHANMRVTSYDLDSAKKMMVPAQLEESRTLATSTNNKLNVLGFWFVNNTQAQDGDLVVLRVAFNNFLYDAKDGPITIDELNLDEASTPGMDGAPLVYPNPIEFRDGGILQYYLTMGMDIQLRMYDIFGRQIYKKDCPSGSFCGSPGENKIEINKDLFNGYELSAGIYFYVFLYEGDVIGRGKMAVVP